MDTIFKERKINNIIEWADKRLQLMGEGLSEKQKKYISFAFNIMMDTPQISPDDIKQMSGGFVNTTKKQ